MYTLFLFSNKIISSLLYFIGKKYRPDELIFVHLKLLTTDLTEDQDELHERLSSNNVSTLYCIIYQLNDMTQLASIQMYIYNSFY